MTPVTIEVDGRPLQARKGAMLIEATDSAGIYVPRFCYHKKLSIAANCRMCLVEVEKAPKPLPACATPVIEGMKVYTCSPRAKEAQKATMEFLLINHPLDCPICDQGGECELQDLAMGYGSDVSRYAEKKRVVRDKDIGPLIQTDMTRCIHCTRCVRFSDEIAGLRELGATGRGEHMEIGTYIQQAVTSELSGNVIDLCPVGALTSKPYRYTARAWELRQYAGIAPHDPLGSNIYIHAKGRQVKRVVPRDNEAVNECWISDRDRYSYQGLYSEDRLLAPHIKEGSRWREVDWDTALGFTAEGLHQVLGRHGPEALCGLITPTATTEELYLFQKLLRGLGSHNIDHRLRQLDFSDQDSAPAFPYLGCSIAALETIDAALLVGSYPRKEQPMANHRLRKAAQRGARVMVVNPLHYDFNYPLAVELVAGPAALEQSLAGIAKHLASNAKRELPAALLRLLAGVRADDGQARIAESLRSATNGIVLLGNYAVGHARYARLRALAGSVADLAGVRFGYLAEAANSAGAWLAGALPHRGPGGTPLEHAGLNADQMWERGLKAYLAHGVEPEFDSLRPGPALRALAEAELVVSLNAYRSPRIESYAKAMLPVAQFAECAGSYINAAGVSQPFEAAVAPPGEVRPGWKVLRVLANRLGLKGFEYDALGDIRREIGSVLAPGPVETLGHWSLTGHADASHRGAGLELIYNVPMYRCDPLVRRATALQASPDAGDDRLHIDPAAAERLGIEADDAVELRQGELRLEMRACPDPRLPPGCVLIYGARPAALGLSSPVAPVSVTRLRATAERRAELAHA